jgi:hypothetical protein
MVRYRNVQHGRIVERTRADEWLEASAGWTRVDEVPAPEPIDWSLIAEVPAPQDSTDETEEREGSND